MLRPLRTKPDDSIDRYALAARISVGKEEFIAKTHKRLPHVAIYYDGHAFIYGGGDNWPDTAIYVSRSNILHWCKAAIQPKS